MEEEQYFQDVILGSCEGIFFQNIQTPCPSPILFQCKAVDFVAPGTGTFAMSLTPEGSTEKQTFHVYDFKNGGGVEMVD